MMKRIFLAVCAACALTATAQQLPYQDPNRSAHERAVDLCSRLTLEEKAQLMLDESPAIPRLGIKKFFWWSEALHGAANMDHVTVFPEPVAMAAAWDSTLLYFYILYIRKPCKGIKFFDIRGLISHQHKPKLRQFKRVNNN